MDKLLFQDSPENNRVQFLKDNCDMIEEVGYMRRFTQEELTEKKERLSTVAIEINDIEDEKKVETDKFKVRLKPLDREKGVLLKHLKNKTEYVKEPCFKFLFPDEGMAGFYNSAGELISSRPLLAEERQKVIPFRKTGTGN